MQALVESLELPDAVATEQALDHALRVLVERLLARAERRGREPRTVRLMARLVGGGSWERTTPLREPTADRDRLLLALIAKLRLLPAPADELAVELGDLAPGDRQQPLFREEGAMRAARLEAAARQVRAAVGDTSALRIVEIDGASRLPERRFGLVPRGPGSVDGPLGLPPSRPRPPAHPRWSSAATACRGGSAAARSRRCARSGASRRAGGRSGRCGGATSSSCWPTGASPSSTRTAASPGAGTSNVAEAAYAELHCHSGFSFLDGASHPDELAERAVELGLHALALTDHDNLCGALVFAHVARSVGLQQVGEEDPDRRAQAQTMRSTSGC